MARWQYRLKLTNLNWGEERGAFPWRDVGPAWVNLAAYSDLQFRRRPRRSPASLIGAVLRRAGNKQQRREA